MILILGLLNIASYSGNLSNLNVNLLILPLFFKSANFSNFSPSPRDEKSIVSPSSSDEIKDRVIVPSAGTVDYIKGEIMLNSINITQTVKSNNIIQIQAYPESNDVIGLQDLYLKFSIGDSSINMVKDTITSGEQISGLGYNVTSSYNNGELTRE